jgi:hypothetical protein
VFPSCVEALLHGTTNPTDTRRSNRRNLQKNDCFKKFGTFARSSVGRGQLLRGEVFNLIDALIEPRTTIAVARFQSARQALDPVGGPRTYRVALA